MRSTLLFAVLTLAATSSFASTKPVPAACTADVNAALASFLQTQGSRPNAEQNNVMVCGKALADSFVQPASSTGTGQHHVILLTAPVPGGSTVIVEIVMNDTLDGVVSASKSDTVFAYGQSYITGRNDRRPGNVHPVLGVHDTHCATNTHMDDGWVVVNGVHYPAGTCHTQPH